MRPGAPTSRSQFVWRISTFDLAWAVGAPFIAMWLREPALIDIAATRGGPPICLEYAGLTIAFSISAFLVFRLSHGMTRYFSVGDLWTVAAATLTCVGGVSLAFLALRGYETMPRSVPIIHGLVLATGLVIGRALALAMRLDDDLKAGRHHPRQMARVLLVGVDRHAAHLIKLTDVQAPSITQIVAALDPRQGLHGRTINGVKIVGGPGDLDAVITEYAVHGVEIDEVWLSPETLASEAFVQVKRDCDKHRVVTRAFSDIFNPAPVLAPSSCAGGARPKLPARSVIYFRLKRALDVVAALCLIVPVSPIALIVAVVVYLDVGAPVTFWQRRIGQGGREFFLVKFRTYRAPFNRNGAAVPNDMRLSNIGRAIRATRLDEIPQLLNILRGDMSLIGPRPLLPIDQPEDPSMRLLVRPGVTGWAQVNGGTRVTPEEKDALDVWYIHHASLLLDLNIVFRTVMVVFRGESMHHDEVAAAVQWRSAMRRLEPCVALDVSNRVQLRPLFASSNPPLAG